MATAGRSKTARGILREVVQAVRGDVAGGLPLVRPHLGDRLGGGRMDHRGIGGAGASN